jgi:hypothetical protein
MHRHLPGLKMIRTEKGDHTLMIATCVQFAVPLEVDLLFLQ